MFHLDSISEQNVMGQRALRVALRWPHLVHRCLCLCLGKLRGLGRSTGRRARCPQQEATAAPATQASPPFQPWRPPLPSPIGAAPSRRQGPEEDYADSLMGKIGSWPEELQGGPVISTGGAWAWHRGGEAGRGGGCAAVDAGHPNRPPSRPSDYL